MKAAVLFEDRKIETRTVADPALAVGEVMVETGFAGICGTDLHIFRGEFRGRVKLPAIQGHEFGGTIVEVGKGVAGFARGERVAVDPILSCHACAACLAGRLNCCRTLKLLGVDLQGGFGQLVAVPAGHLYKLPDSVPLDQASMVEVYALGHHILDRGRVQPGESVAILGAGKLGLSVLDVLCHGASPALTVVADVHPFRLETARKLGADVAVDVRREDPVACVLELTGGAGVDCVIECVGHHHDVPGQEPPLGQAVRMIRHGGRVVTAGLGEPASAVHFKTLVLKEGEIIASRTTLGEFGRAVRLLGKGLLHPELLITHRIPLSDVGAAFDRLERDDPSTIKIVLEVGSSAKRSS
jgi:2-desacetyl-2-hydroxyethyl bacteriochlorophyllide A dehydrogenase